LKILQIVGGRGGREGREGGELSFQGLRPSTPQAKTVHSYAQLNNYLLKYVMKPEKQSDFFSSIAKTIAPKLAAKSSIKRAAQKILIANIGQRDMSINECMLIVHGLPYVEYSKTPRVANLRGSSKVSMQAAKETDCIGESDNWQEAYWNRDKCSGYKQLIADYPHKF
jgi:hypothetical protein